MAKKRKTDESKLYLYKVVEHDGQFLVVSILVEKLPDGWFMKLGEDPGHDFGQLKLMNPCYLGTDFSHDAKMAVEAKSLYLEIEAKNLAQKIKAVKEAIAKVRKLKELDSSSEKV